MQNLGMAISVCAFLLVGVILFRGISSRHFKLFPLFYSYMAYVLCGSTVMYLVYGLDRRAYPSVYWFYYLISILVEFSVLVEISDHIFQSLPAVRRLGRALTIVTSGVLALLYVLPAIVWSHYLRPALLDFALRASVTKIVVLIALFFASRQFRSKLGKNVAALMLGFSIYMGVNVANLAAAKAFDPAIYGQVLWILTPTAYALCLLVWTIALWDTVPARSADIVSLAGGKGPKEVALELAHFNSELSKLIEK